MTKVLKDAKEAYEAWQEAANGSYIERTMEHAIARDIVPALIHALETAPKVVGFDGGKNAE